MTEETKSLFDTIANKSVTISTAVNLLCIKHQRLTLDNPEVQKLLAIIVRESSGIMENLRSNYSLR